MYALRHGWKHSYFEGGMTRLIHKTLIGSISNLKFIIVATIIYRKISLPSQKYH